VLELLQERVTLFSDLVEATGGGGGDEEGGVELSTSSSCRNLFRADTPHAPQAEPLLTSSITEGESSSSSSSFKHSICCCCCSGQTVVVVVVDKLLLL